MLFSPGYGDLALYVLVPAVVGAPIGWLTRVRMPIWVLPALPLAAIVLFLVGWSQYNDDGDSGPLIVLVVLAVPICVASALVSGVAAGASWRRLHDGVPVAGGYGVVDFGLALAGVALATGVVDAHPVYAVSGLVAAALLFKTRSWWAGLIVPYGFGVWATFVCLAIRTRRSHWLVWAVAYLAAASLGLCILVLAGQNVPLSSLGSMLCVLAWGAGLLHALRIRAELRSP